MRGNIRVSILGILGLGLVLAGLIGLYSGPRVSQYAFAPKEMDAAEMLSAVEKELEGAFDVAALHGISPGVSIGTEQKSQEGVTLYQVSGEWHEAYPQTFQTGRPLSRGDQQAGSAVIVLDDETAFQLFGDQDPIGQKVKIGEKLFETVGVAKHGRRIGETDAHAAWIPIGISGAPEMKMTVLSAAGSGSSALQTVFENTARNTFGEGQAIHLGKERTRGTIILRVVILVTAIRLLTAWFSFSAGKSRKWLDQIRERRETAYLRQMAGFVLIRGLGIVLLFGAGIAAAGSLAAMAGATMQAFPEWVPEILVEPESIAQRFWELTAAAAAPAQWKTPELAEIRFWSAVIRWGTVLFLLGKWERRERQKKAGKGENLAVAKKDGL